MKRSNFFFIIMSVAYLGIAIGVISGLLSVTETILIGLSITSFSISVGDIFANFNNLRLWKNDYFFCLKIASNYLGDRIQEGNLRITNVDVFNVKCNLDQKIGKRKPVLPKQLQDGKKTKVLIRLSYIFFISGIVCFLITPYIPSFDSAVSVSKSLTIFAFAAMCFNIFLTEMVDFYCENKTIFENETQVVIESVFPGYMNHFYMKRYHNETSIIADGSSEDIKE